MTCVGGNNQDRDDGIDSRQEQCVNEVNDTDSNQLYKFWQR